MIGKFSGVNDLLFMYWYFKVKYKTNRAKKI